MNTLIQSQIIAVPATTGTTIYKTQFDSDKNFQNITGIYCGLVSGDVDQDIEVEFRDDSDVIFSFSPAANWIKDTEAANKDLTELFRAVAVISKGRNIYCNVKATNTTEPVKFVVYYRQENAEGAVKAYNFETYKIDFASLPNYKNITLPNRFKRVVGIAATTDSAEASKVMLRVENTQKNLVDPVQLSAVTVTASTLYDQAFFPVDFAADGQELKVYFDTIEELQNDIKVKVYFLLTD